MEIRKTCYSPSFNAKFIDNQAFRDVVKYAQENNCLRTLDSALNTIKKADPGNIGIGHGVRDDGGMYSFFTIGRRSVNNAVADAQSPAEASFDGILELSMLTKKFKSLIGTSKPKQNITPDNIIKEYTV